MNPKFKAALAAGHLEIAMLPDGPFVRPDADGNPVTFYWATETGINLYAGRFHAITDLMQAHNELKLTAGVLDTALPLMDDLCRHALLNIVSDPGKAADAISDLKTLLGRLQQRRTVGMDIEQVYDIAAAWFFIESEDPAALDSAISNQKKRLWYAHTELYAFFLASRFNRFVPFVTLLDDSILNFSQNQTLLDRLDLTLMELRYGNDGLSPATSSIIKSRQATQTAFDGLLSQLSKPITTTSSPGTGTASESDNPEPHSVASR